MVEVANEFESTLIDFLTYPQFPSKTYDELTSLHKDLVGKHIVVAKGYQNLVKYYGLNWGCTYKCVF